MTPDLIPMMPDGRPDRWAVGLIGGVAIEDEIEGYQFDLGDATYTFLMIEVADNPNENIGYGTDSNGEWVQITPGGTMWVVAEFLSEITIEL